jgi:hypothetical protein
VLFKLGLEINTAVVGKNCGLKEKTIHFIKENN